MSLVQGTQQQGAKAALPPIPKMDQPPSTEQLRQQAVVARQTAKEAAQAARDAARAAVNGVIQAPVAVGPQGTTTVPADFFRNMDVPPRVENVIDAFFLTLVLIVLGLPLMRVIARRIDRPRQLTQISRADMSPQLRQLQESVDAMAIEIERISESQRFQSKLLAEKTGLLPGMAKSQEQ